MSKYDNIDPNRQASFRQYDFTVYKMTVGLAKKRRITERLKAEGGNKPKVNPKFRILKARVGASLSKYLADQGKVLTHGDVQKYLANPVIPKEVMELIDLKITAKKK